jgi:RNA polymerase sigma factor (TIGR02999 family)
MSDVTRLLDAAAAGDRQATVDLFSLVYDELRKLAAVQLANEPAGHTLQPTALVHEVFVRLVGPADPPRWENRGHFFAAAAEAMRRILVDAARRKKRVRRGGDRDRVPLPDDLPTIPAAVTVDDLLDADAVLDDLAAQDPTAADLVKLHVFGGLPVDQAAAALGISPRTAYRTWSYARAWMVSRLGDLPAG